MAKGYEQNQLRQGVLARFAKDLVRRSRSKCELCECGGEQLNIMEVVHGNDITDANHCVFICGTCFEQIHNPKKTEPRHWHCLNNAVWSEVPAVQVVAARMLRRLSSIEHWANELLEEAYFETEIEEWAAIAD